MLDDENQARRLARAICSDVLLYNAAAKDAPLGERVALLTGPVNEGRELFRARVTGRLAGLFEREVDTLICTPMGLNLGALNAAPPGPPEPRHDPRLTEPQVIVDSGGRGTLVVGVVLAVVLATAAAIFLLNR